MKKIALLALLALSFCSTASAQEKRYTPKYIPRLEEYTRIYLYVPNTRREVGGIVEMPSVWYFSEDSISTANPKFRRKLFVDRVIRKYNKDIFLAYMLKPDGEVFPVIVELGHNYVELIGPKELPNGQITAEPFMRFAIPPKRPDPQKKL